MKRQINYDNDRLVTAQRLKEAMSEAGITLTELAEKSHVSKSAISQYTHATSSPSNLSSMAMAKVLGVSPVWLMGFDVDKHENIRVEFERFQTDNNNSDRLRIYNALITRYYSYLEDFSKLPEEGKAELRSYMDYLMSKYKVNTEREEKQ